MKTYPKLLAVLLLAGATVAVSTNSFARQSFGGHGEGGMERPERTGEHMIERLTKALAETDYPLTEEQVTTLQNIEFGPDLRSAVRDILTEEQHTALEGSMQKRRHGRGKGDRDGFRPEGMNREAHIEQMEKLLEEAGNALTPEQKEQLAALEPGPESRGKVHEILTEEQAAIIHENRPEHPEGEDDHEGRKKGGRRGMMFGKALEDAGVPLTDEQKEQLGALEHGEKNREALESILTDEQKGALEEAREKAPKRGRKSRGRQGNPEMLFEVLEDAGQPLTEAQKTAIGELEHGESHRGKLMDILTDEQKEALKAAAKEHRGRGRGKGHDKGSFNNWDDNGGHFQIPVGKHGDKDADATFALHRNYPNPFNPTTTIRFDTLEASHVTLDIYNIDGQRVRTLVDHYVSAGPHTVVWNGKNELGQQVSAGQYFYTLNNGTSMETQKMVFMK